MIGPSRWAKTKVPGSMGTQILGHNKAYIFDFLAATQLGMKSKHPVGMFHIEGLPWFTSLP